MIQRSLLNKAKNKCRRLVVNGCSYMHVYSMGNGHVDLAEKLRMRTSVKLAISGSNNSRILRTTLKDSYQTIEPTLYVLGMTFINRNELPILKCSNEESSFEGKWANPQNFILKNRWEDFWIEQDTDKFVSLHEKASLFSGLDLTEDLMYRMLSVCSDLERRGHRIIMYQQADTGYHHHLDAPRLNLFKNNKNIIGDFKWCSIQWQHSQGVPVAIYPAGSVPTKYGNAPDEMRHRQSGEHHVLNNFLTNYIEEYKILE